jgi:hypothetical protein
LLLDARVQVHDEAASAQQRAVVGVEHGAAAGSQHDAIAAQQFGQHRAFACAETGFAFVLEDLRHARSGIALDLVVEVEQPQSALPGQRSPTQVFPAPIGPTRIRLLAGSMPRF